MTDAIPPAPDNSAWELRSAIRPERRNRGVWVPTIIFLADAGLYLAGFVGVATAENWWVKAAFVVFTGHLIGMMFMVGHDACHGSFTGSRLLNGVFGRLALLPSLTPFTAWRYTHNGLHHAFTNCGDKDFVWRPLSPDEYRSRSRFLRWLERTYRTVPGLPLNWIIENWWKHHAFPNAGKRSHMRSWGPLTFDRALVAVWFVIQAAALVALTPAAGSGPFPDNRTLGIAANLVCGLVLPFLIWSTLMSYVDLLHHTHPGIRWFRNRREASFFETQLEGTAHVVFRPRILGWAYHNIMEHTAHHVDCSVPMYRLKQAQRDLEARHRPHIVVEMFSLGYLLRILRACKLYDYDNHRWVGYDGAPIPLPTPPADPAGG